MSVRLLRMWIAARAPAHHSRASRFRCEPPIKARCGCAMRYDGAFLGIGLSREAGSSVTISASVEAYAQEHFANYYYCGPNFTGEGYMHSAGAH